MPDSDDDQLRDALTDIHGIGDAKAAEILDVVESSEVTIDGEVTALDVLDSEGEITDADIVAENVRQAADYHDAGDHAYAAKFVRRAADALDDD